MYAARKTSPLPSCDVLLVVPPFGAPYFPFLGVSILAANARKLGIRTHIYYANLDFAALVGPEVYEHVAYSYDALLNSEAIFASAAFPGISDPAPYLSFRQQNIIRQEPLIWKEITEDEYRFCLDKRNTFLEQATDKILAAKPEIVGLCSMFQQNMASIALARRIKQTSPDVLTVMGGAGTHLPMGQALAQVADPIDCIFTGEADDAFPRFCRQYMDGSMTDIPKLVNCGIFHQLDELPIPDFDDYMQQLAGLQSGNLLPADYPYTIYFESSRGCWWGDKNHCRFCGMNADGMAYRNKSAQRVVSEIETLARRYRIKKITSTDCIMPERFAEEVCPELAKCDHAFDLQYEVKANLKPQQLDWLKRARINTIQPGVESLCTDILKLMNKGIDAIQNIGLLRNCISRQIVARWHLLFGVPGEKREHYLRMFKILPMIAHLQPPVYLAQIRLDRFSPYFEHPHEYGISNIRINPAWYHLYPPGTKVDDLIYRFESDWHTEFLDDKELLGNLYELVGQWKTPWLDGNPPELSGITLPNDQGLIYDTRPCAVDQTCFVDSKTMKALQNLESRITIPEARKLFDPSILDELLDRKFILAYEGHYLSLVTDKSIVSRLEKSVEEITKEKVL
jgi:ribosomal peptide maturation radical SAM protein 1